MRFRSNLIRCIRQLIICQLLSQPAYSHPHAHPHTHAHMHTHTHPHTHAHTHAHTPTHPHTPTHTPTHTHTHPHTHTRTHTHTHAHAHTLKTKQTLARHMHKDGNRLYRWVCKCFIRMLCEACLAYNLCSSPFQRPLPCMQHTASSNPTPCQTYSSVLGGKGMPKCSKVCVMNMEMLFQCMTSNQSGKQ